MKKFIVVIFFILFVLAVFALPNIVHLYLRYFSFGTVGQDALSTTNTAIQIGYNILYLIIALAVLLVAYYQLSKTRESNVIQNLNNIDNYLKSGDFLKKRQKLAQYLLDNDLHELSEWIKTIIPKKHLTTEESEKISITKNVFEGVIYQFELIAYYYTKRIFDIEDIYQLFSIEIQQYWVIMDKLNFIEYLRKNHQHPRKDYYDKFEILFNDTLKQEIINESNWFSKTFLKIFYWTILHRIYNHLKKKNSMQNLINLNKNIITNFLNEEKNLVD